MSNALWAGLTGNSQSHTSSTQTLDVNAPTRMESTINLVPKNEKEAISEIDKKDTLGGW